MVENMIVADRLYAARGRKKRTEVAKELGIPYETLREYESGRRFPSRKNMVILSDYYGIPIQELFF